MFAELAQDMHQSKYMKGYEKTRVNVQDDDMFGYTGRGEQAGTGTPWADSSMPYDFSGLPGFDAFTANPDNMRGAVGGGDSSQPGAVNRDALAQWMADNGYELNRAQTGARWGDHWVTDSNGQDVGDRQRFSTNGEAALWAGMLGLGVAGGAAAGLGAGASGAGAGGVEAGAAGAYGGAYGGAGAGAGAAGDGLLMAAGGDAAGAGAFGGWGTAGSADLAAQVMAGGAGAGGAGAGAAGAGATSGGGILGALGGAGGGGWGSTALQLGGAALSAYGSKQAADAQIASGKESNALLKSMYDQQRADYAPYREAGTSALSQIQALLKDPSSITTQPDYQFGLNQGIKARENSAASRGMLYSGAQQKELQRYGNDYAGTKLNESYNRLSNLAGIGQVGASGSAQAAGQYGSQAGNNITGMGNARGSAYVGAANAFGGALGNIGNQMQENQLWKLYNGNGG
jgi:hypothetical protein